MGVINIPNLNDGINIKADPSAISDGSLEDCIGFDLTTEGIIETARGLADNDISARLPVTGDIQCMGKFYIGNTMYVLATTPAGLYVDAVLKDATFTGRFKAIGFIDNIYMVNGVVARRFNGTSVYQWGITAPTSMPTITIADANLINTLDNMDDATVWTANQSGITVAADASIVQEGSASCKFTAVAKASGFSYKPITANAAVFPDGNLSTEEDYFRFWLYVDSLANLSTLEIQVDVWDGTFTDYFSYTIISPGLGQSMQLFGEGKTSEEITGVDTIFNKKVIDSKKANTATSQTKKSTTDNVLSIFQSITGAVTAPTTDQVLSFWRNSDLFQLKSAAWQEIKICKKNFIQAGDVSKDWSTISAIKVKLAATASGTVNVYIDDMAITGGSDLVGDYWFMYTWGRTDALGNVVHESQPAIDTTTRQFIIQGPVTFDRHPLKYWDRVPSTDPQVNCCIIYAVGGSLLDFWQLAVIPNNNATTGTITGIGDRYVCRKLQAKHNEVAPPGTDLCVHKNKIWMVGDPSYPSVVRSSDILDDGTLAPEGWPSRNGYEMSENSGRLFNINVLNQKLVVKGDFGEWALVLNDPTDFLQVVATRISDKGLMAQDGVIAFPNSHVYPSNRGFVESNASTANFILPEVEPLIDSNITSALGVDAGLVSYFAFNSTLLGTRTAKVDLYRGKPRFSTINDILPTWMHYDSLSDTTYCVVNGDVYILDSGYTDESIPGKELRALAKSKLYRMPTRVAWTKIDFYHYTGGIWYNLEVYIDGELKSTIPFMSTTKTRGNFRFGPHPGVDLQFYITGYYTAYGFLQPPVRIYHSGT